MTTWITALLAGFFVILLAVEVAAMRANRLVLAACALVAALLAFLAIVWGLW